jgi:hypothetical protein
VKLVVLLLVVLVVVALVLAARAIARRGRDGQPWALEEVSDGELVTVRAVRPGNEPLLVGAVPFASADFESRLEELRAEGRYKLAALNSGRRQLRR